jgi:RNA polymerase sigma-70 factor (ECF subfamily)
MSCIQNELTEFIDLAYSYAFILVNNQREAENLVRETYVCLAESTERLQDGGNAKISLLTVLRKLWLKRFASSMKVEIDRHDSDSISILEGLGSHREVHVSKIGKQKVRAAIQQLPVKFREIILLHEYAKLTQREIATILNCPFETVVSHLQTARSKLRTELLRSLAA